MWGIGVKAKTDTYSTSWVTPQLRGPMVLIFYLQLLPPPWWCIHVEEPGIFKELHHTRQQDKSRLYSLIIT